MNEVITVGGYIRVSTAEQSMKGLSLESQQEDIQEYCDRNGYKLYRFYIDRGITARKDLHKRESFMEMMNDVKDKKIGKIVVIRLDRFFRNVYDYHRMMNEYMIPNGCEWSAVKEEYDTTTTNGRLMINLRLAIAEQESDQDSDRIKDVFNNRIKAGYVVSYMNALGYDVVDKRLVPNDDARIVKFAFDRVLYNHSVRKTMLEMNQEFGTNYSYQKIRKMISDELYIGKHRDNKSYCQPLIDEATFYKVQKIIQYNIRERTNKETYIFSQLITCCDCGRCMCGKYVDSLFNKSRYHYYRCAKKTQDGACDGKTVSEKSLEKFLVDNIEEMLSNYKVKIEATQMEAKVIKGNRKQIEAKLYRLNDLYITDNIDLDEYKRRKKELESQIVDDVIPQKKDLSSINAFLNSGFKNVYYSLNPAERSAIWHSIIERIYVRDGKIESVIFCD